MRFLAKAVKELQRRYPLIHLHIVSEDKAAIMEQLDRGLIDFGLVFGEIETSKYEYIQVPYKDTWGVIMRRDSPLAKKETITAEDLMDKPLIISRQAFQNHELREFFPCEQDKLNIVATYNLLFNGSLMVDEGIGYAISFDKIINVSGSSHLCFRPLEPKAESNMSILWKKYQVFTKAVEKFL